MPAEIDSPSSSRALVTARAASRTTRIRTARSSASASFLTQLIASASRVPQTRERRRAEAGRSHRGLSGHG